VGKPFLYIQPGAWVSGEPQYGFLPHKGVLSPSQKVLYISYANAGGPYDGTNGTVHKYNITSGVWTDISPTPMASTYYGYGGLSVDIQTPGTLMVTALNSWWPDGQVFRSTDSVSLIWKYGVCNASLTLIGSYLDVYLGMAVLSDIGFSLQL
jgi:xyloglucan-specific exo-beta-1,4-glucanase